MKTRAEQLEKIVRDISGEHKPFLAAGIIDDERFGIMMSGKPHQIVNIISVVLVQLSEQTNIPYSKLVKALKHRQKDIPESFRKEEHENN